MDFYFDKKRKAMNTFKGTNLLEFIERFKSNDDCYQYLLDLKWGKGFTCSVCSHRTWVKGKTWYYRRCQKCEYDESATAGTLFHKLKFPLLKAFHILFRLSTKKKGISSVELSREFGIQQKTAWLFKQKAQVAMKSSGNFFLKGKVHVDEFSVGGPEIEARGRSDGKKSKVILAVEIRPKGKMGMAYAQCIEDYSSKSFKTFFNLKIDKTAAVETDGFRSYGPLRKNYKKLKQYYSNQGKSFPELHVVIMNFKSWLRGIHHKCQDGYLQKYLDEFFFRFNRRNHQNGIFNTLVKRFINEIPCPLARIQEVNA